MSVTDFGSLEPAVKRIWAAKTWEQGRDNSFWMSMGFLSSGDEDFNAPVQSITKLTKTEGGSACVMQLVADLEEDGIAGDNQLDGNEERMFNDSQEIQIDQLRHGVRSKGEMSEQDTVIRFRKQARNKLAFWIAEKIDELLFLTAAGRAYSLNTDGSTRAASQLTQLRYASQVAAATSGRIMFQGSATTEATLTASDTVTWDFLVSAKAKAKRAKMNPIRKGGKEHYVVVLSTEQIRDLKQSDDWKTIASRAAPRAMKHPLFDGAVVNVDGLVIHEHNKVFNTFGLVSTTKWGASGTVDGAQGMLFGAQALGFAAVEDTFWREADVTDYGNRQGVAVGRKFGMLKPKYKTSKSQSTAEDFGVMSLKTAAAAT